MTSTDRPTDRHGLEVLDLAEALDLAASEPLGRIGFQEDGVTTILPVNHLVHGTKIMFRTASGAKFDAAILQELVAFEVDHYDRERHTGWSVLFQGRADLVEDEALVAFLEVKGLHSWVDTRHDHTWVQIIPDEVSGRRLVT